MTDAEKFYAHLDLCGQCREHPFDLCEVGARLIVAAGRSLSPTGRPPTEPVFQHMPMRTEAGRELRKNFARVFGTDILLDLSKLEERIPCPACEAGIPKHGVSVRSVGDKVIVKKEPIE